MRFKRHLCFSILFFKTSGDGLLVCGAHDQSWCRWNAQQNRRAGHKGSNMEALEGNSWESGGSTLRVAVRLCRRPCRLMNAVEATPVSQLDQPCSALYATTSILNRRTALCKTCRLKFKKLSVGFLAYYTALTEPDFGTIHDTWSRGIGHSKKTVGLCSCAFKNMMPTDTGSGEDALSVGSCRTHAASSWQLLRIMMWQHAQCDR